MDSPHRVLLIDDSRTICKTAETMLAAAGYTIACAENGFEAMGVMFRFQPRLVFVDIMMPRLDGYQTCAMIKNNPAFQDTPVVMLSSRDGLFDRARGRLVGASDYLTKPFSRSDLLRIAARFLPLNGVAHA